MSRRGVPLIKLLLLGLLSIGCAHAHVRVFPACEMDKLCTISGRLMMLPYTHGQAAWIEANEKCVVLALPEHVYSNTVEWKDKQVEAEGTVYPQVSLPDGSLMWYMVKDRRMSAGVCPRGIAIYVTNIRRLGQD